MKKHIASFSHVASPRLPMPHIAISLNFESEDMYVKNPIIAPTKEFAAMPHKSIFATDGFPFFVDILNIKTEIIKPKTKARMEIKKEL